MVLAPDNILEVALSFRKLDFWTEHFLASNHNLDPGTVLSYILFFYLDIISSTKFLSLSNEANAVATFG